MEGLDEIPWGELRHNDGAACDVPALLRAVAGGHEAADALEELAGLLFHTGERICTAAAAATPFLVELAEDPDVTVRARIVSILAENASEAELIHDRCPVDPAWFSAWAAAVLELVRLLDDDDAGVRRATAYALAHAGPHTDAVLPALLARFSVEPDPVTRRDLVLTVARLTAYEPSDRLAALRDDPDPRIRLAATFGGGRTVSDPGTVIDATALEDVSSVDDPSEIVRAFAVHLIVAGGSASAHRDRLAGLLGDRTPLSQGMAQLTGDLAVWGLSWAGDRRAQAGLLDRLTDRWSSWPPDARRYDASSYGIDLPGLDELLARLDGWSDALLPAVRATLSRTWLSQVQIPLMRAPARWGPAAAPAVPELIRMLRIGARRWAATALGAIGPDAAPAVDHLRDLLRHDGAASGERPLWNDERVEIAWALWRVTGDGRDAVRVLTRVVEPLAEGRALPVMRTATRYLAGIGPPAAAAIPALRAALALDRRLAHHGGWRAFDEDRRQRDLARDALRRISP
ncbi:HEAT repeat domain-containing protein [Streptosporangium sp. NPDC023615]|uniref:HEAT repeat domain-containing protein n=1 Tax=Streptosporangium sp. NPDC023615 TaxID=3154794 RepID=UPI0034321984